MHVGGDSHGHLACMHVGGVVIRHSVPIIIPGRMNRVCSQLSSMKFNTGWVMIEYGRCLLPDVHDRAGSFLFELDAVARNKNYCCKTFGPRTILLKQ